MIQCWLITIKIPVWGTRLSAFPGTIFFLWMIMTQLIIFFFFFLIKVTFFSLEQAYKMKLYMTKEVYSHGLCWHHDMEMLSALLAICEGTHGLPSQRPSNTEFVFLFFILFGKGILLACTNYSTNSWLVGYLKYHNTHPCTVINPILLTYLHNTHVTSLKWLDSWCHSYSALVRNFRQMYGTSGKI